MYLALARLYVYGERFISFNSIANRENSCLFLHKLTSCLHPQLIHQHPYLLFQSYKDLCDSAHNTTRKHRQLLVPFPRLRVSLQPKGSSVGPAKFQYLRVPQLRFRSRAPCHVLEGSPVGPPMLWGLRTQHLLLRPLPVHSPSVRPRPRPLQRLLPPPFLRPQYLLPQSLPVQGSSERLLALSLLLARPSPIESHLPL
jgi:hypothetical protein